MTLPEAMRCVTRNPAQAVGLGKDYGSLGVGKVADLLLVVMNEQGIPKVQRVFVGGKKRSRRDYNGEVTG
jgi:alpha-D-ribose 1-methylphosphonate 5-triphosphate diphosphatase